ncbi:MAG TPA: response regulator transcription factor [Sedimentisphaerales bacterium]|nr:response regulator transcription factor [Sedimentisphaerales bacterium]
MAKERILIVDDEEDILELLSVNLKREGYDVLRAQNGEDAVSIASTEKPDLVILDLMLPGVDGLTVCAMIKRSSLTKHIPIIMLTAKGQEADIVKGLEQGADDYMTKPFSPKVLMARVKTALRRRSQPEGGKGIIKVHDLVIDTDKYQVFVRNHPVELTHIEFSILQSLAKRPGRVFSRYQIIDAIHGTEHVVSDRAIDVQIVALRKKLGKAGDYIETVRGVGYRFKE